MPAPISIYLIRHGESEANLNKSVNAIKADHPVELSPRGQDQAVEAGTRLAAILTEPIKEGEVIAAYVSPYNRTRQTWNNVKLGLREVLGALPAIRERESIYLRELEFGLFDGIADEELSSLFPLEYPHYNKLKQAGGEYYARMPCGESRCDVAQRVHQGFGSIHRDHENTGFVTRSW
jgi:broad specificity phosphatase PhoE